MKSKSILGAVGACTFATITAINLAQADGYEIIDIGTLGGFSALASDINNDGTMGGDYSSGLAINNSGQVVGYSKLAGDEPEYVEFLYTDNSMRDLCTLTKCTEFGWDSLYLRPANEETR